MVVGESKRTANIMEGIENTGDVRLHDHRLRLKQRFDIVRKLGQGTYGKVQLGINKKTGQEVAIKTIKKCKIESDADLVRIRREVQIMSSVRHPNIVHIYEVFENSEKMILVMEYCSGGELYDYLSQQKVLPEEEARRLFRQIATAVYYCHIHKICHRDLKLENVLLDETGSAKIADFGLSNVFKETSLLSTFCGSPLYASPEIVKGTPYIGPEVDCWSLGVLLYTLVYGAMPFDGSNFKRLVRQISNGDYFEPKSPSSASPLIRDMLTVDPIQRADITYICDHPWVNVGFETSCLVMAEGFATETPVRLDLLLSLAPPAPAHTLLLPAGLPSEAGAGGPDESGADLTSSSMAVEPSSSAEKRILDLVAEGGADAIKPSPTRTIVSAVEASKRKLEQAASTGSATAIAPHRKRERVASCARLADMSPSEPPVPEEPPPASPEPAAVCVVAAPAASPPPLPLSPATPTDPNMNLNLKSSATVTTVPREAPKQEGAEKSTGARPRVAVKKKISPTKTVEEKPAVDKPEPKENAEKGSNITAAADKLTGLSLEQPAVNHTPANHTPTNKPKKLSIAGMSVGSFKEQFERRASLTTPPDVKKNLTTKPAPVTSKIAKPKAQSEDREIQPKAPETGTVRLQQIGIEPSPSVNEEISQVSGGVKKTESEPGKNSPADPAALSLQDARRSLQNSMALLSEGRTGDDSRRRAARELISSAIRTGKPPMPYGRSSSAGVTALSTPPATPPATVPASPAPRTFRTEALHTVGDHRNRGTSVERIIPIQVASEDSSPSAPTTPITPVRPPVTLTNKSNAVPLRRLASETSTRGSEHGSSSSVGGSSAGEPIKKSAREFIIPIAVEGKGYVTPRQGSLEPDTASTAGIARRYSKPRRISLVSGGESEDEDDMHMHRLRSSRAARAESVSSGEEEDEEGFHLLTAENLFSTLLHRVRALTNRLNGEEGTGFPQHSLFNNLQSPFFNSPHLPRRHRLIREGRGGAPGPRDLAADFDSMFNKRTPFPRGSNTKKSSKQQTNAQQNSEKDNCGLDLSDLDLSSIQLSEKELETLSGLTPGLSRRLQKQLLAHLPPAAARSLRRTLSLHATGGGHSAQEAHRYTRSLSAKSPSAQTGSPNISSAGSDHTDASDAATLDSSNADNTPPPRTVHPPPPTAPHFLDTVGKSANVDCSALADETVACDTSAALTEGVSIENTGTVNHCSVVDKSANPEMVRSINRSTTVEQATTGQKPTNADKSATVATLAADNITATSMTERTLPKPTVAATDESVNTEQYYLGELDSSVPQFCTLPRLKRHSILSRESTPPVTLRNDSQPETPCPASSVRLLSKDLALSRGSSVRSTPDRSLLSKYLTPDRTVPLEESYSSDSGSLLSEPSYIAAYGSPALASLPTVGSLRRHSLRLQGDQSPRKRISRFLRPDFFETPRDESTYARTKKDKENETQKILKEIREKRNKNVDSSSCKSPSSDHDVQLLFKDEMSYPRPCLSPISGIITRDRSRSTTPFFPILHNIKETAIDSLSKSSILDDVQSKDNVPMDKEKENETSPIEETKLKRPKSYPIKNITDNIIESQVESDVQNSTTVDCSLAKPAQRESKLVRPKSYPSSSPSPEKVYITRATKKDESSMNTPNEQNNIEVSFSVNLPKKDKPVTFQKSQTVENKVNISIPVATELANNRIESKPDECIKHEKTVSSNGCLLEIKNTDNGQIGNSEPTKTTANVSENVKIVNAVSSPANPTDEIKTLKEAAENKIVKITKTEIEDKKPTIKKKIIKKVSSKSKLLENGSVTQESSDSKSYTEKKKVTRKVKEKEPSTESTVKKVPTKKKSVLQTIGHKLEKLTSSKSNSPEKDKVQDNGQNEEKSSQTIRDQREQSVPPQTEPSTESNLIKRAVTLTNVSGLDNETGPSSKTTVSKVLGLFKKFEPKDKSAKSSEPSKAPLALPEPDEAIPTDIKEDNQNEIDSTPPNPQSTEKPIRPTSLLLNGLGRKNKYCGAASDSVSSAPVSNNIPDDEPDTKNQLNNIFNDQTPKENNTEIKNSNKNNLKLDFSRLPRIKQNVGLKLRTNDPGKSTEFLNLKENTSDIPTNGLSKYEAILKDDCEQKEIRAEEITNGENNKKQEKIKDNTPSPKIFSNTESPPIHPQRNHESTTPDKEDIVERIRRKSFYTRFNEKRHKRKSNLVGPGAQEYNPAARLHSQPGEAKYDVSPTSPVKYDLSPTYSTNYDLSPTLNCDRFKSLNPELPTYTRHHARLDNYGGAERVDAYRSLDRKYTGSKSYLEPEGASLYASPRYTRTISLFDNDEHVDNKPSSQGRDPHKYTRTVSMYSPGNYATYRPMRVRNPAILLKESEKEISPENIMERIRERKRASAGASSKMGVQTEPGARSNIASKSESDSAERVEKTD